MTGTDRTDDYERIARQTLWQSLTGLGDEASRTADEVADAVYWGHDLDREQVERLRQVVFDLRFATEEYLARLCADTDPWADASDDRTPSFHPGDDRTPPFHLGEDGALSRDPGEDSPADDESADDSPADPSPADDESANDSPADESSDTDSPANESSSTDPTTDAPDDS